MDVRHNTAGACGQYATFFVGELFFGIEVLKVQEVLRYQDMTRVPLAPSVIEGLINLRGQIVTAIDMRRLLKLAPRESGVQPMNMIIQSDESAVSLLVDEIGDVIEAGESCCEPAPANMPACLRGFVDRVYTLEGRLLLVLNTDVTLRIESSI